MENVFNVLTEETLVLFAAKHYYNPRCTHIDDFYNDLKRFKYIKRLINRYQETGKISERLILNHVIVAFNVFGIKPGLKILELKLAENQWPIIIPFLQFLNYLEEGQYSDIEVNTEVTKVLGKI